MSKSPKPPSKKLLSPAQAQKIRAKADKLMKSSGAAGAAY